MVKLKVSPAAMLKLPFESAIEETTSLLVTGSTETLRFEILAWAVADHTTW